MKEVKSKQKFNNYFEFHFLLILIYIILLISIKGQINENNTNITYKPKRRSLEDGPLNNIINYNISFIRYFQFASYSNGDMVLQFGSYPYSDSRFFIGFKKNGRAFFRNCNTNEYSYFYSMNITNYINASISAKRYESKNLIIKLSRSNNKKEYLISYSYGESNVEIYDFDNDKIYIKSLYDFTELKHISSFQNMGVSLFSNNSDFYYLFGFIGSMNNDTSENRFVIQKHKFISVEKIANEDTIELSKITQEAIDNKETGFSCFQTEKQIIICFILNKEEQYIITAYNTDLNEIKNIILPTTRLFFKQTFYKCVHLKEEIGIFTYFRYFEGNVNYFPVILFKEYNHNNLDIINYIIPEIIINKINILYDPYLFLNDLINLNNNKICLCSTNNGQKNILYFILINLFTNNYIVRYYEINIFDLYGYSIHLSIRAYNYNNFLALAFSNHNNRIENCKNNDYHKSCFALLMLNYPNSTDNNIILDEYLINEFTINNINVNLEKYLIIENNIFGYVFSGIEIKNLINCENLKIMSSLFNNSISLNYILQKNENIKLEFRENNVNSFICNLHYNYKITENYTQFNQYLKIVDAETSINIEDEEFKPKEEYIEKEEYIGRLIYFDIILKGNLSSICYDKNCDFCYNETFCINCKYNYTLFNGIKNCLDKIETDIPFYSDYTSNAYLDNENDSSDNITQYSYDYIYSTLNSIHTEKTLDSIEIINSLDTSINTYYISDSKNSMETDSNYILSDELTNKNTETIIKVGDVEIIKRDVQEKKDELIESLPDIINTTEIGKTYEMIGEDFSIIIKPTNVTISSSTHVDFSSCEKVLRKHYNISDSRIVTFLQLELNDKNSKSLINQVGYQAYDDNKNILDLSLCNDTNIQIFYLIKSNSSIDISFVSSFKDLNIDVLNIKDDFFNDICTSYSENEDDIVLKDRINDFYKNYSLCEEGCTYKESNFKSMIITCDCKVKQNLTTNLSNTFSTQSGGIKKSSPFAIIKCYKLVFSWENKLNNIGFCIFTFLIIFYIIFLLIYYYKGINPIKEFLIKEMEENGYIEKKNIQKSPPKKKNNIKIYKTKKKKSLIGNKNNNENSSLNNLNQKDKKHIIINNIINNNNSEEYNIINNLVKNTRKIEPTTKKISKKKVKKRKSMKKKITGLPTHESIINNIHNIINEKTELKNKNGIELNLININLKNRNSYPILMSKHILNTYTFEEANKNDYRSICRIFYIYLLAKQIFFHAFFYRSPLVLFPLRFSLLIFIISSDLALNALFYFDDKISEKYKYAKSLFLFAFNNNMLVILLSTFIGFILLTLFIKLINSTNSIREIFRKEEQKLKNDKKYVVTEKRIIEIKQEIENVLENYKIKVLIFFIIEIILMLFFAYYVTAFCHVYSSTQNSWLWDSFLSILSRITIDALFSLAFAKLYRLAVESKIHCLYKISLFFYSFG